MYQCQKSYFKIWGYAQHYHKKQKSKIVCQIKNCKFSIFFYQLLDNQISQAYINEVIDLFLSLKIYISISILDKIAKIEKFHINWNPKNFETLLKNKILKTWQK